MQLESETLMLCGVLALWVVMHTIIFHGALYLCPVSGRKAGEGKKVTHRQLNSNVKCEYILRHKIVQCSQCSFLPEGIVTWRITAGKTEKQSACVLFFGGRMYVWWFSLSFTLMCFTNVPSLHTFSW